MTITQHFYSADLILWRVDGEEITEELAKELYASLNTAFSGGKRDCTSYAEITSEDSDGDVLYLRLEDGDGYYECECDYTPGYPDHITADPYYSYPGCGPEIDCYEDTYDMLKAVWKCPEGWDWELDGQDFEEYDDLAYQAQEDDGPDPDQAYEEWRDRQLEEDY